jgi:glycine cleavage system regulatory protein
MSKISNNVLMLFAILVMYTVSACGSGGGGGGSTPASSAKAITAFSFTSPAATGIIDENAKSISVTVPYGTNVTALVATFTTTGVNVKIGSIVQASGATPNDFTNPVAYTVTASDNSTVTYAVTVTIAPSSAKAISAFSFASPAATGTVDENAKSITITVPHGTNVTALVATFTATGASVKVGTTVQVSGSTPNDFTSPVSYTVTAADNSTATYIVAVTVAPSSSKAITAFSLLGIAGTINEPAKTISVTVPYGTNVTALVATFTTTGANVKVGTTVQVSGSTPNDFTSPVAYIVTAADNSTATYTVTVYITAPSSAKAITAFSFTTPAATGVINESQKTISVTVPYGTNVTALIATFATTGASVMVDSVVQESGTTQNDFTYPLVYTVTAEDSSIATYTVTVTVASSTISLPKTGQSTIYATGDDASLQKGVAWPSPRFTDNSNGTITDNLTGLMWLREANCINTRYAGFDADGTAGDGAVTWQHALDFVAGINTGTYTNCGSVYSDWRLPDIKELRSLMNYEKASTTDWLSTQGFINFPTSWFGYWSSTTYAANTGSAWMVFPDGSTMYYDKNTTWPVIHVWPVRAGQGVTSAPAKVPRTGQITRYAEGDDGALQKGVLWPNPRFTDNGDGTVTDHLTVLVWLKDANCIQTQYPSYDGGLATGDNISGDGAVTWQHALDFVAGINNGTYPLCGAGHNDWRLPNTNEIESLTHAGQTSLYSWLKTQGFINVMAYWYWTSTSAATFSPGVFAIDMNDGRLGIDAKPNSDVVWPVRGGQ